MTTTKKKLKPRQGAFLLIKDLFVFPLPGDISLVPRNNLLPVQFISRFNYLVYLN